MAKKAKKKSVTKRVVKAAKSAVKKAKKAVKNMMPKKAKKKSKHACPATVLEAGHEAAVSKPGRIVAAASPLSRESRQHTSPNFVHAR
jgi:hypothetical protein